MSKKTNAEALAALVREFRASGASSVSVCLGDDALEVEWPEKTTVSHAQGEMLLPETTFEDEADRVGFR